jgi:uncharacterized protein YqhQ
MSKNNAMKNKIKDSVNPIETIGGQAVVEGIMIRSPRAFAVAVRKRNGDIVVKSEGLKRHRNNSIWKKPGFRGVAALGSTFVLGMKAINFSASFYEEEAAASSVKKPDKKKKSEKNRKKKTKSQGLSSFELIFSIGIALLLTIFLYKALPLAIAGIFKNWNPFFSNTLTFNLVDAVVKILILIAVMWGFGFMKDIRRMYQYHGAEHMSVFTYEAGKELNVRNAKKFGTLHPRCGTNFLILVFVISLFFFLSINPELPFLIKLLLRIAMLPIIAAVTYELMRYGSRHMDKAAVKAMMMPGLWLQKITTKTPGNRQLEVAIAAVKEVLEREKDKTIKPRTYEIKMKSSGPDKV